MSQTHDFAQITKLTNAYFDGLHIANTEVLNELFHSDVVLKAPDLRRSKEDWLQHVASRKVPKTEGHPYAYKILSIELYGDQAMVKAHCPLLGSNFVDFLGLLKEDGKWRFVSKMYADI